MSWFSTVVVAVITAAIGCVLSGYVATLAIRWYNISSFEGGSGYYMLAFALLGLVVGLGLGFISPRVVGRFTQPGFLPALGLSVGSMLILIGLVGGVGRIQADVAPTIDGEPLMVIIEAKWPTTQKESPALTPGISFVRLGSIVGRVQRKSEKGALWKEDAKLVDGRWVVTGAVSLFTERGDRSIDIALNDSVSSGFVTRLPRRPGKEYMEWSEWYPRDGRNGPPKETGIIYRYRVQKWTEPLRTEKLGAFDVVARASSFHSEIPDGTNTLDPYATFKISYNGKEVRPGAAFSSNAGKLTINRIAKLPSDKPALLVIVDEEGADSFCVILIDDNGTLREQYVSKSYNSFTSADITADSAQFASADTVKVARGRVDQHVFARSTLLLFQNTVVNARTLGVYPVKATTTSTFIPSAKPMGASPDLQSYARYHRLPNDSGGVIAVTDFVRDKIYELPIDTKRMRWVELKDLTPQWLLHHFEWKKGPEGHDILVERANFLPIPYHGSVDEEKDGSYSYRISSGGQEVRLALIEYLKKEFAATTEPVEEKDYEYPVMIDGKGIRVATTGKNDYVLVQMKHGEAPTDLIKRIGNGFNTVLATGRYDSAFEK